MAIVLGIVVVVIILVVWNKSKKSVPKKAGNKSASEQYPYGMAWPKPKAENLWDSFDYFVRLGEVWARHASNFDENTVYLRYVVKDFGPSGTQHAGDRGHFELAMSELTQAKGLLRDIPYLQTLGEEFVHLPDEKCRAG